MTLLKCPFCGENEGVRRHGSYFVKVENKSGLIEEKNVDRFFCKSCKRLFSSHTKVSLGWRDGVLKSSSSFKAKGTDKLRDNKPIRLPSEYKEEKREELFKRIDQRIRKNGIEEVSVLCQGIGISHSTYYKYLREFKSRFRSEIYKYRDSSLYQKLALYEVNISVPFADTEKKSESIKFILLFDLHKKFIVDYFFLQKRKSYQEQSPTKLYGHRYTHSDLVLYFKKLFLEKNVKTFQLKCSTYLFGKLVNELGSSCRKISPKLEIEIDESIAKYRFFDSPKFIWAIYGPYKKRDSFKQNKSKQHLISMVETLIAVYNSSIGTI